MIIHVYTHTPMKDFGMVILSQTLSFTVSPEDGVARAFAILYMGVVRVSLTRSPMGEEGEGEGL